MDRIRVKDVHFFRSLPPVVLPDFYLPVNSLVTTLEKIFKWTICMISAVVVLSFFTV